MDDRIGSIEPGKLADLAVIDGNLLATPAETIRGLPIWMTVVGGKIAHGERIDPAAERLDG
jgi:predicted amidohydrolase YtcJ